MHTFVINKNAQPTGEHEVHWLQGCGTLPRPENRIIIGDFANCKEAIKAARLRWPNTTIDGCENCIPGCHTK